MPDEPAVPDRRLREVFQRLQPALYLGEEQLYSHVEAIEPEFLAAEKRFVTGPSDARKGSMPWSALLIDSASTGPMPPEPDKNTPAILLTTSGTTGQPKFVTHTPATLSAIAETFVHVDLGAAQAVLNTCPMVHITGLVTFLASVNSMHSLQRETETRDNIPSRVLTATRVAPRMPPWPRFPPQFLPSTQCPQVLRAGSRTQGRR